MSSISTELKQLIRAEVKAAVEAEVRRQLAPIMSDIKADIKHSTKSQEKQSLQLVTQQQEIVSTINKNLVPQMRAMKAYMDLNKCDTEEEITKHRLQVMGISTTQVSKGPTQRAITDSGQPTENPSLKKFDIMCAFE